MIVAAVSIIVGGLLIHLFYRLQLSKAQIELKKKIEAASDEAKRRFSEAQRDSESLKRELLLQAKEEIHNAKLTLGREVRARKVELQRERVKLEQREAGLERQSQSLSDQKKALERRSEEIEEELAAELDRLKEYENSLHDESAALDQRQAKLDEQFVNFDRRSAELDEQIANMEETRLHALEEVASFTVEEAREEVLAAAEERYRHELALRFRSMEETAQAEAEMKARDIVCTAIQRYSADYVSETTVSVVILPSDEMKGRIIGREGRNIRAIETITGVDVIIDDTPEAVILSSFDPVRREIARLTLEKLVVDGRIHPARIEDMVERARKEVEATIRQAGEEAVLEVGLIGLHPELIRLLGRLKYRTSYGQNVLNHSLEVAWLTGMMAAELNLDQAIARRSGLLHDIGKAIDFEVDGSHVEIGAEIARKYNEDEEVISAIESHHGDKDPISPTAILVAAADALSAARPGARRENVETYIKRIRQLEEIANSFPGVEKAFAIQAGREVRVMVRPEDIRDDDMQLMAHNIGVKINEELKYPGSIKVNLIRETRVSETIK